METKIRVTLSQINNAELLDAWDKFCDKYGYSYYAMSNGGESVEVDISLQDALDWGVIKII